MRTLSLTSLAFALIATGALSLAVATDYWLFTMEPIYADYEYNGTTMRVMVPTNLHSGLWRACPYFPGVGKLNIASFYDFWTSDLQCYSIGP